MKILLEDYQRRLGIINNVIKDLGEQNKEVENCSVIARLREKAGEYRSFITDIERAINREMTPEQEEKINYLAKQLEDKQASAQQLVELVTRLIKSL
jgi:hypothetical protein